MVIKEARDLGMILEIVNVRRRAMPTAGEYFSVDSRRHVEKDDGVALCGMLDIDSDQFTLDEDGSPVYHKGGLDCPTWCIVCSILEEMLDGDDDDDLFCGYELQEEDKDLIQLVARTEIDGQVLSDWLDHKRDPREDEKSFCGFQSEAALARASAFPKLLVHAPSPDVDFEGRKGCTWLKSCEPCEVLAEVRRRENLMADPEWVAEQMSNLRHMQEDHRKYGDGEDTMTVRELIGLLSAQDMDAPVVTVEGHLGCPCCWDQGYRARVGVAREKGWIALPDTGGCFVKDVHPGGQPVEVVFLHPGG